MLSSFRRVPSQLPRCIHSKSPTSYSRAFATFSTETPPTSPEQYPPIGTGSADALRSKPFQFTSDVEFQKTRERTPLAIRKVQLTTAASKKDSALALEVVAGMKREGIPPDLDTYNLLLRSMSRNTRWSDAWAIFDDMVLFGIKPDVKTFNALIDAHQHKTSSYLWPIIKIMEEMEVEPNATTYGFIINYFASGKNLESALRYLNIMKSKGIEPELQTLHLVVEIAAESGNARLALDLVHDFETDSVRRLESDVWLNCLTASVNCLWKEGVLECWEYIVQELNLTPGEAICISVLHTAARHGLPDLAADVLRVLKMTNVAWEEHHIAALIEAFCRAGQIKEAFMTVDIMPKDLSPSPATFTAILDHVKKDIDTFDSTWALLDEISQENQLDISSLNVVIGAAVALGDLQRAVGAYKSLNDYNVKPTQHTFHLLLEGTVAAGHQQLGDRILQDMKDAHIPLDQRTYELLIELCLTQETYEDAFPYLEEMKEAGFRPSASTYIALVKKCAKNGDARYAIALEEMEEMGHKVDPEFLQKAKDVFMEISTMTLEH